MKKKQVYEAPRSQIVTVETEFHLLKNSPHVTANKHNLYSPWEDGGDYNGTGNGDGEWFGEDADVAP